METAAHRRYLIVMVLTLAAVIAAAALLNRAANPYCLFASDWFSARVKPETFTHLRLVKAMQTRHLHPQAIILGSSRAETGLDPAHPAWAAQPVYNLGLSDAGIYEIKRYFQHACAVGGLKQAVLLLDFTAFLPGGSNAPDFREDRLAMKADGTPNPALPWKDYLVGLASWDACVGSAATLLGRGAEKRYLPDGSRDANAEDARVLSKGGAAKAFAAYEKRALPLMNNGAMTLGTAEMGHLRDTLALARKHHVDLRLAIAPMHARYLEMISIVGQWDLYEQWKREITRLVEEEAAASRLSAVLLMDFGGYDTFTTEEVPQRGLARYYLEASHFTKTLGDILLARVLSPDVGQPQNFGVRLEGQMIAAHLAAIRDARAAWRAGHAADLETLKAYAR